MSLRICSLRPAARDSDWVVKLIDVYPDNNPADQKMAGYQLMVVDEIFRGRYRQSFEKPSAIAANLINEYVIDLRANNHTFKKGHRVMVQVQSTLVPTLRSQPAEVRREHLQGSALGLSDCDAARL